MGRVPSKTGGPDVAVVLVRCMRMNVALAASNIGSTTGERQQALTVSEMAGCKDARKRALNLFELDANIGPSPSILTLKTWPSI